MDTVCAPDVTPRHQLVVPAAWVAMLAVSELPEILLATATVHAPDWLLWAKIGFLAAFAGLALWWRALRRLRSYGLVLLAFFLALKMSAWVGSTAWWQDRFARPDVSFARGFAGLFLLDTGVALVVIAALCALKRRPRNFFLTRGRLDAPIAPVAWLGIKAGESWRAFGWIFAGAAGVCVLFPTVIAIAPSATMIARAAPLLPVVLLLAAINAFNEEIYFRSSLLSTLNDALGKGQTLLLSAVFFGLAHYLNGSPPGVPGVLMTGFLAWLIGKSMLETGGFLWPWFIHFVPDVVVFASYALLRVQP